MEKRQFYHCELGAWGTGKVAISTVQAWRLGERKRDYFTSASLEVGGTENRQFYQCKLGGWGRGKETILPVQAWRLGERKSDQ